MFFRVPSLSERLLILLSRMCVDEVDGGLFVATLDDSGEGLNYLPLVIIRAELSLFPCAFGLPPTQRLPAVSGFSLFVHSLTSKLLRYSSVSTLMSVTNADFENSSGSAITSAIGVGSTILLVI